MNGARTRRELRRKPRYKQPASNYSDARARLAEGLIVDVHDERDNQLIEHSAIQFLIGLLTVVAILLSTSAEHQVIGYWVGLASQPFWLIATWRAGQWGMFAAAGLTTAVWIARLLPNF